MKFTSKEWRPYVSALGQLALSWNSLHEVLNTTFSALAKCRNHDQSYAIWHAVTSDRNLREMLLAAAKNSKMEKLLPKLIDEIKWICDRTAGLEEIRNNALHSPLWHYEDRVIPLTTFGHIRAKKIANKDLLKEFRWCRDAATVLSNYAWQMTIQVAAPGKRSWPQRPKLPNRGGTSSRIRRPLNSLAKLFPRRQS